MLLIEEAGLLYTSQRYRNSEPPGARKGWVLSQEQNEGPKSWLVAEEGLAQPLGGRWRREEAEGCIAVH